MTDSIMNFLKSRKFWCVIGSILLMALIAVVYFYPDAVTGNTLSQHDMEQGSAIGHEAQAYAQETATHRVGPTHFSEVCRHSRSRPPIRPTPCSTG